MTKSSLGDSLGIGDAATVWAEELAGSDAFARDASIPGPSVETIETTAQRCGFRRDVTDVLVEHCDVWSDPEVRRLAQHGQWRILERYDPNDLMPTWPVLNDAPDAGVRLLWAYVALSLVGEARARHARRGVAEGVSDATLWDIGQQVWVHRQCFGTWGMGEPQWLRHHLTGHLFQLGRLQFQVRTWFLDDQPGGPRRGEPVLDVHIPEAGPLTPEACEESYETAREFFARHFPDHGAQRFMCLSWLLDPQLAEHLDADANIVVFGQRFTRLGVRWPMQSTIFRFVFHEPFVERDDGTVGVDDLDRLPERTTLERAVVAHVRAGRRFHLTPGWFDAAGCGARGARRDA